MPRRKELRLMLIKMLDMVQTIKMYASEPIKPSNIRVFDIKPEIWDWLCQHEEELIVLLYGWKQRKMPVALAEQNGAPDAILEVNPDRAGGSP